MTNQEISLDAVAPVAELSWESLDSRYVKVHIVGWALAYMAFMALALLLLLTEYAWLCVTAECVIALAGAVNLALLPRAFLYKGYALREHDISYRSGLFFPKVTTVPFARIQQVSLGQNPVSKIFGLYSVEVVNGAQSVSSLTIPGLPSERARRLKDFLTDMISPTPDDAE